MKAVCIVGMTNSFSSKAGGIVNSVVGALDELGLSVVQIKLIDCYLPYYEEGALNENFAKLSSAFIDVKNIILSYNAADCMPCAVMKVFLEYLSAKENRSLIDGKNILNISISETGGEKEAADYVAGLVERLGGFELTRICIGGETLGGLSDGSIPISAIEKYAEDYYRLTKQNRVFLRSSAYKPIYQPQAVSDGVLNLRNTVENSMRNTKQSMSDFRMNSPEAAMPPAAAYAPPKDERGQKAPSFDADAFNSRQQEDIEELTRLFAGKMKSDDPPAQNISGKPVEKPRAPLLAQPTQPLQHTPARPPQDYSALSGAAPQIRQEGYPGGDSGFGGYASNEFGHNGFSQPRNSDYSGNQYNYENHNASRYGQAGYNQPEFNQLDYNQQYQRVVPPPSPVMPQTPTLGEQNGVFSGAPRQAQYETSRSVTPREKTCRQMTQSLPHYFQSQLAQDTEAVFQFNISGDESFLGYIVIRNKENEYYEGQYDSPDITIVSNANVWQDVLKGKLTAQKAFMTGQLKVRGNFTLLNRFDQLYKKM